MNHGSRKWIKLWVDPWLSSTMRFTLDHKQRAVWADLLALGGQSRISGVICAGEEGGKLIGLPLSRIAGAVDVPDLAELSGMLDLFEKQERITVEKENGRVIIRLLNWSKYQSEYSRQNRYKAGKKQATRMATPSATREATGGGYAKATLTEVEVEVEVEEKNKNIPSPSAPVLVGFDSFWDVFPRKQDKKAAQKAWSKIPETERSAVIAAVERFKLTEQWQKEGGKYIPYPSRFLNGRRWEDEILTSTAQIPAESNGRAPRIPTAADCRPRI